MEQKFIFHIGFLGVHYQERRLFEAAPRDMMSDSVALYRFTLLVRHCIIVLIGLISVYSVSTSLDYRTFISLVCKYIIG